MDIDKKTGHRSELPPNRKEEKLKPDLLKDERKEVEEAEQRTQRLAKKANEIQGEGDAQIDRSE